jgi:Fic family protein
MNNWIPLLETLSQLPILSEVDKIKKELDALRPLSREVEGRVMQKLKLEWNYHSNAIEGNKLTYGETYTFLMYGLTAKGKPFKDHLDIKGHDEAIKFLISLAKEDVDLTEVDIRNLHKVILVESYESPAITLDGQKTHKIIGVGEYKKMPNHVKTPTGETHYYATPEDVPILMGELVGFINLVKRNQKIHPSVLAAFFHHRFVEIHPFDDGNGRLGRILMNLVLMQHGFPPAIIKLKERTDYYAALGQADKNEYEPIVEFVAEALLDSMNLYLKAAKGGNIEESDDLDKEIALFKGSFGDSDTNRLLDLEINRKILNSVFLYLYDNGIKRLSVLNDMFDSNGIAIKINDISAGHYNRDFVENIGFLVNKISVSYVFYGFKKSLNGYPFSSNVSIEFSNSDYKLFINDENVTTKKYGEYIDKLELDKFIERWLKSTFELLKRSYSVL